MDAQFYLDNAIELNPNKQINYRLTVANVVRKLAGGTIIAGQAVIVPEAAVMDLFGEMLLRSDRAFEIGASDNFRKEFVRMMREAKAVGAAFFVGKGYWDITVWLATEEAKRQAIVAGMYVNDTDARFRDVGEMAQEKGLALSAWAVQYARTIGLNEDAH